MAPQALLALKAPLVPALVQLAQLGLLAPQVQRV